MNEWDSSVPDQSRDGNHDARVHSILLVIQQELLRSALLKIIGDNPRFRLLPAESAEQAMDILRSQLKPDVILIDAVPASHVATDVLCG